MTLTSASLSVLPAPDSFRQSLSRHREWIERRLGVRWSATVCLLSEVPFSQVATRRVLGYHCQEEVALALSARLQGRVESLSIPGYEQPLLNAGQAASDCDYSEAQETYRRRNDDAIEWMDCPVAIKLRGMPVSFVAIQLPYVRTLESCYEQWQNLVVVARHAVDDVMKLIAEVSRRSHSPQLCVLHGNSRDVAPCDWSDLVVDDSVARLLRNDFTTFHTREDWFRRNRLPFRRGYLLHGAPGNGKTTAIRAMMWARRMDGYTLRLFHPRTDDVDLERLFARAHANRPCLVVFEDLDRAWPRAGQSRCQVSLQALLNTLDGLVTTDGVVVVATANHPTRLDPAILRRPGRFDRVVHFDNPSAVLRTRYFQKLNPNLCAEDLTEVVRQSCGQSFAELREAYIVAGQLSFERGDDVGVADLLEGVRMLRSASSEAKRANDQAGFHAADGL